MGEEDKKLGFFAKKEPVWVQGIHLGFSLCEEAWQWCNYREIYLMIYLFKWDFSVGVRLPKKVKEASDEEKK